MDFPCRTKEGVRAFYDVLIPFEDPYANQNSYDPKKYGLLYSQLSGEWTKNIVYASIPFRNAFQTWHLRDKSRAYTLFDLGSFFRIEKHFIGNVKKGSRAMRWHIDAFGGYIRHWPWGI